MTDATKEGAGGEGLSREVRLWPLVFYGAGTILGAGIFVVVGEVVAEAGRLTPLAYLIAAAVAVTTGLAYGEMAARVPTAGGPTDYVERAFGSRRLGSAAGWTLLVANTVSAATITTGFTAYLSSIVEVPNWIPTTALILVLSGVAALGIKQSTWLMTGTTLVGIAALLGVLWFARDALMAGPGEVLGALGWGGGEAGGGSGEGEGGAGAAVGGGFAGLLIGAFLAVYAFVGFGDMALTAEEVRDVEKTMPRAISICLALVFAFYMAISLTLAGVEDVGAIAEAEAPLVEAVRAAGGPATVIAAMSLVVILNGALTQIVGAARLLLDLGRDGRGAPAVMGRVSERTDTPLLATAAVAGTALALALFLPLKTLAEGTSLAILLVFLAVNASLWRLKGEGQPDGVPDLPRALPAAGAALCLLAFAGQAAQMAGLFGGGGG